MALKIVFYCVYIVNAYVIIYTIKYNNAHMDV